MWLSSRGRHLPRRNRCCLEDPAFLNGRALEAAMTFIEAVPHVQANTPAFEGTPPVGHPAFNHCRADGCRANIRAGDALAPIGAGLEERCDVSKAMIGAAMSSLMLRHIAHP
jgi:hypothetical protein